MTPVRVTRAAFLRVALSLALVLPAAAVVRGADAAGPSLAPPVLPAATYSSVAQEVLITMDDGVRLAATLAFPSKDGKTALKQRFPVVVGLTPYGRNGVCGCYPPSFWATRGIIGGVVDVRGTGGSEGNLGQNFFSPREARDGARVVDWLGTQPWSTGKVGMAGGSYVGITQYLTAEQQPRHLAAIAPQIAISDLYRDGFAHGGIESLSFDLQYIAVQGTPAVVGTNTDPALAQESVTSKLAQSPLGTIAFDYLARPEDDTFYRDRSPIYRAASIKVPVLDLGEWRDGLLRGETEMYQALKKRKGVETRLIMGPCTHKGCGVPFAPLNNPEGLQDESAYVFEFLSKYLRGTEAPARPPVQYYLQGANKYVAATTWPPAASTYTRLRLSPGALGAAAEQGAAQSYVSNPAAGASMALDQYGTVAISPYIPTDQRLEEPQGLTFRTPALTHDRALTGPIALHLVASSTAKDTDWYAKLADVAPDGSESIITAGALRASHRALDPRKSTPERPYHVHTKPTPIAPGQLYAYDLEIWPTAYALAKGHRLQLRITSTDAPTHLDATVVVNRDNPSATRVTPLPPAVNTIRLDKSYLLAPLT